MSQAPLWSPSARRTADTALDRFRRQVQDHTGLVLNDSSALHAWSTRKPAAFWELAFTAAAELAERGDGVTITPQDQPPGATFFAGSRLCYAEHLLAGGDRAGSSETAIVARREDGRRTTLNWRQLRTQVARATDLLSSLGVGRGERVAAWMPNSPTTLVMMLATNSLGAVFTSASPDFGPDSVADRFSQVAPAVLIAPDGYCYGGKEHDRLTLLPTVLAKLPSVRTLIVSAEITEVLSAEQLEALQPADVDVTVVGWPGPSFAPDAGLDAASPALNSAAGTPPYYRTEYAEPGFILYSSGTTGRPKCIVHSATGLLVKHWTEHVLHCDVAPGDVVFYYTTCGWMMWNWLASALAWGATIVLYDGSPFAPADTSLWDLAAAEGVTLFGTSAKYLDACRKAGLRPRETHQLSALRTITSTGSPLSDDDFRYVYEHIAPDVHLASISGGTDICGCFVLGDPTRAVYAGEIQGPALGVEVDVAADDGASLRSQPGVQGDLVCRAPMPSMPLAFFGDPAGVAYRAAYFEGIPGVWTHGDFAEWTDHGGIVISGRSDATLNSGGVRIGTAEIYRQVEHFDEVAEAMAVGRAVDNDTQIVLFVIMAPGHTLDDDVAARIRVRLRSHASPRHVPAEIIAVADLPRTRSGKLAELAVADALNGRPVRNTHSLVNPECLSSFTPVGR